MSRLAFQHLAAATLTDEFSVAYLDFASYGHDRGAALNLHSFETIVIVVHVLQFRGDHATVVRVVNNEVGITAHCNRALAREKAKKFRGARASGVDEAIRIQASAFHPVRIQKIDAILDSGNAVGNIDEGIFAEKFLLGVKRAMIRSNGVDRAECQRVPQYSLIVLCAQRRRHDVLHAFDTGPLGIRLVEKEVRQHGFHMNLHATRLRSECRMQGFLTRQMDHIASGSRVFEKRCEAAGAFSFDRFGAAGFMPLGAGPPFREQLLLQTRYEFRVFTVRGDNHSEALGEFEGLVHFAVIDAEKVFVGQKDFERRRAVSDNLSQLRFRFLHKLGDRHVEGIVARTLAVGLRFPELIAFQRIIVAVGTAHFDIRCRSANESRDAAGFMRVLGKRRHERKIDMDMRINETWKNEFARGVDDFRVWRSLEAYAKACDGLVFDVDVRLESRAHSHNFAIPDQQGHLSLPQRVTYSSINMNAHFFAVFLHLLPILGYFRL